jgi:hypothetical protein
MSKLKVFEYMVLLHPNTEQVKEGKKTEIIVELQRVLAADERMAGMQAIRAIPEKHAPNLDQIEVAVRAF